MHDDLPKDLSHPRRDRRSDVANIVTALVLFAVLAVLALTYPWGQ